MTLSSKPLSRGQTLICPARRMIPRISRCLGAGTRRTCASSGRQLPQSSKPRTIATLKVERTTSAFAYVGRLDSTPSRDGPLLSRYQIKARSWHPKAVLSVYLWSLARNNCDVFGKKSSKVLPHGVRMTGRVVGLPSTSGGGAGGGGSPRTPQEERGRRGPHEGNHPRARVAARARARARGTVWSRKVGTRKVVLPVNKLYVPTLGSL